MSEYPDDRKAFDELVANIKADDKSFSESLEDIEAKELSTFLDLTPEPVDWESTLKRYLSWYGERNLEEMARRLNGAFREACDEFGIDPEFQLADPGVYREIGRDVALAALAMKSHLWEGDVVSTRNAVIVDLRTQSDTNTSVVPIHEDERVIGTFVGPYIAPMPRGTPEDVDGSPLIGVGILLKNPIVIDSEGTVFTNAFEGQKVYISLATRGLHLTRLSLIGEDS